jgi:hypothetical protein
MRDKRKPGTRPRTFHLSVGSKTLSSQSTGPTSGIRKPRSRRHDLAVFEEETTATQKSNLLKAKLQKVATLPIKFTGVIQELGEFNQRNARVQPLASADANLPITERWSKASSENEAVSKLQKIGQGTNLSLNEKSLQEIVAKNVRDSQLQPQVRFQPKPPKPRRGENRPSATDLSPEGSIHCAQHSENQGDFVYDTYLRTTHVVVGAQLDTPMDIDTLEHIEIGKVGILIIAEQDEAVWETFAEEEEGESDKDWNSEEEDENGTFPRPL